jgi:hypothetical protein
MTGERQIVAIEVVREHRAASFEDLAGYLSVTAQAARRIASQACEQVSVCRSENHRNERCTATAEVIRFDRKPIRETN